MNDSSSPPVATGGEEHVLGADGKFHVTDEPVDLSIYGWEDWISFALFWLLAFVVFYQVFTRYALNDPAGWTEEIARYMLVTVVFIGASMSVRKNNHIQVDVFYRFMPPPLARACSTAVDLVRSAFLGYAAWLTWLLIDKIGQQRMAIVDLPMVLVFGPMMFGFTLMFWRSLQVGVRHWRSGYSVLERPEVALEGGEK
ncbi:MAG: TRAP transporter small permease [Betaproteobacteria bacterium]|nr:TRAP transporter small permease [Betaproteobacteria bacterium]